MWLQHQYPAPVPPTTQSSSRKRGYIILKKTFQSRGYQNVVDYVNGKLQGPSLVPNANVLQFTMDKFGHYYGRMNHEAQKHTKRTLSLWCLRGYYFRFQYDAETFSTRIMSGDSYSQGAIHLPQNAGMISVICGCLRICTNCDATSH